ncbi:MAG: hypothetical protein ABR511_11035 [Acidimicrobiales bacterium]
MGEHAVFLYFDLDSTPDGGHADPGWGRHGHGWPVLQRRLDECAAALGVGRVEEFDFAGGQALFYLYGPDAHQLLLAARHVLGHDGAPAPVRVVVRRGPFEDPDATEAEVDPCVFDVGSRTADGGGGAAIAVRLSGRRAEGGCDEH